MSELDEIRENYEKGELNHIKKDLEHFLISHKDQILEHFEFLKTFHTKEITIELAVKLYIIKERSINPRKEIEDQLHEIEREKWIRGVQLGKPPDPSEVATEWARKYSEGWRSHRVTTIIFVFEQEKERYLGIIK